MNIAPLLLVSIAAVLLSGCYGMGDYLDAERGWKGPPSIDPEQLRVDSSKFPQFRAKQTISPPPPPRLTFAMVEIRPDDVWDVRYRLADGYVFVSKTYNDRQCRSLAAQWRRGIANVSRLTGNCVSSYLYGIYADLDGNVINGWEVLPNPEQIGLASERRTILNPKMPLDPQWRAQPIFEAIRK